MTPSHIDDYLPLVDFFGRVECLVDMVGEGLITERKVIERLRELIPEVKSEVGLR